MSIDLDESEMARLTAEVERLQQIQAEMQREFAKGIKAARCEAERWRVLCGEWKQVINELQDKLAGYRHREHLVRELVDECLTFADGELWANLTDKAKAVRNFGDAE